LYLNAIDDLIVILAEKEMTGSRIFGILFLNLSIEALRDFFYL